MHAGPATIMAWERKMKTKVSKLAEGVGMEDLLFMAWDATKAAGLPTSATLEEFAATVYTVENGEGEAPAPFDGAASAT